MASLLKTPPPSSHRHPIAASRPGGTDPELLEETETLVQTRYAVQRLREISTTFRGRMDLGRGGLTQDFSLWKSMKIYENPMVFLRKSMKIPWFSYGNL